MHPAVLPFGGHLRHLGATLIAAWTATAVSSGALAQNVNHEELQKLFGEPVTTSVTGKPQRVSEAAAAVVIITRDDIRRSPAHDIPGLLQAYAGIDVVRPTAGQADVGVRGGVQAYDPRLLVLVNGRQVYLDSYGLTNWAGIGVQLEEVQQIEIVKGPNSALFGFNALSGVVNIITINPLQTQQMVTTVEAGSESYLRLSQSAAVKIRDGLGLRLSGGIEKSDELDGLQASPLATIRNSGRANPRHTEATGEVYGEIDDRTEATVSGTYTDTYGTQLLPILLTLPMHFRFGSVGGLIEHDTGWGIVSSRVLKNWSMVDVAETDDSRPLSFRNKVSTAAIDVLAGAGTSDTFRAGLEYRRNQMKMSPGYPGAIHYDVFAGSAMWEHRLNDRLTFTTAGRIDYLKLGLKGEVDQPTVFTKADFQRSITAFSNNSVLLWKLNNSASVRFAASRGIQAPSLYSLGARVTVNDPRVPLSIVTAGNPNIDPTRINSIEVGYIRSFEPLSCRLEITGFYNRTTDVIGLNTAATPPLAAPPAYPFLLSAADNVGSFRAYGLETALSGRVGTGWQWLLNYSRTEARQNIVGNADGRFERPLAMDSQTPKHKLRAQLSYQSGPWLASAVARYTSRIGQLVALDPQGNSGLTLIRVDDSLAIDAKLASKIGDSVTVAIAGENLLNRGSAGLSVSRAERRLRASLQIGF